AGAIASNAPRKKIRGSIDPRVCPPAVLPPPSAAAAGTIAPAAAAAARVAAAGALRLRARFVHVERAALELGSVQSVDRGLRFRSRLHLDEAETARIAAELVAQHGGARHAAISAER